VTSEHHVATQITGKLSKIAGGVSQAIDPDAMGADVRGDGAVCLSVSGRRRAALRDTVLSAELDRGGVGG
jgi:hypothetical protein